MVEGAKTLFKFGEGIIFGAGTDQLMYALTAYIPQLSETPGWVIPGYAAGGIHYDDLISLGISAAIAIYGGTKRNYDLVAKGVGMLAGNFIASQFQQVVPKPPELLAGRIASPIGRDVLVRID